MNWNKFFTFLAYGAGAAATIIASGGLAVPGWVVAALAAVGTVSGKMAASHSTAINQTAVDTSNADLG